jgi:outer membrane protein assembly factor BamB
LVVLDQATGDVAWQVNVPGDPASLFALADRVGVVVGQEILTWSGPGEPTRTVLGSEAVTRVAAHNGVLYVGLAEPALLAADATTGAVRWRIPLPARPQSLTASDDLLYLSADDTRIYFYRTTGDPKWVKRRLLVATRGDPAVDDRFVYFTFQDNSVRAFDRKGGAEQWSKELGSRPKAGPMLLGPSVAVALETGAIIELTAKTGKAVAAATPTDLADARLQFVAVSADRTRLFTIGTSKDDSRIIATWGHPAPK